MQEIAKNVLCKKPYILRTPFWNYLATTLFHYSCIIENYEPEIKKHIDKISNNILKSRGNKKFYLINIWANIWRYTIGLAKQYWYDVLAFEPWPSTFKNLRINTLLSDMEDKIELYNLWLWNANSYMNFSMSVDCDAMWHITDNGEWMNEWNTTIKIPVKKFDDLWIDKKIISETRLIIMDVEWFELNVLKWMKNTLLSMKNINIIMEIRSHHKDKESTISFMKNLWYKVSQIDRDNWLFIK